MKFNVPKHLEGRAKLAELVRQAVRPPLKVTYPTVPLLDRRDETAIKTKESFPIRRPRND